LKLKSIYNFLENVFSLFSVKVIDLAIAIWLIPYLILKVGIQNYGLYAFALALMFFFMNISNYGFDLVAVRTLAKDPTKNNKHINTIFNEVLSVKIYIIGFLLLVLLLLNLVLPSFRAHSVLYLFASFLLLSDLFSLRWFFIGVEKMKFLPVINLLATLIYALLVLLFIKQPTDYIYIILFEAIGLIVVGVISFSYVLNEYQLTIKLLPFKKVMRYIYLNFSSFINLFVPSVLSNVAVLLVGFFSISTHVSFMQLAVKFSNAFATLNAILAKVFYPIVNRNKGVMKTSFTVLIITGVLLSVAMFFSADYLIAPWLKLKSEVAITQVIQIIKILSPTPFLMAVISAYGINGLLVYGKDKLFGYITLISTLLSLIMGLILIPKYTYIGGALFLLTARGLYALGSFTLFNKKRIFKAKK